MKDDPKKSDLAKTYKKKVEEELTELCDRVLTLLDDNLIPNAADNESKVCTYFKGDVYTSF